MRKNRTRATPKPTTPSAPPPKPKPTPRALADAAALDLLRDLGRQTRKIQQAHAIGAFDSQAEASQESLTVGLIAIGLERDASRMERAGS